MVVAGSAYVLSDLTDRTAQFGPAAWLKFDWHHILLAMLVVNAGVLAALVVIRRVRRGSPPATNLDHPGGGPPAMLDELVMAFQVIIRPNSAFATLRDDDHRYFWPSIVVMLLTSIVMVLLTSIADTDLDSTMPPTTVQQTLVDTITYGLAILAVVAYAGTVYLIGRALGGNKSWRKVLTVLFYASIVGIPAGAVLSLQFLLPPSFLGVALGMMVAVSIWAVIICVKAVKVLNGFGTAKAFGIMILSEMAQMVWVIPVVLVLYLRNLPIA